MIKKNQVKLSIYIWEGYEQVWLKIKQKTHVLFESLKSWFESIVQNQSKLSKDQS